MSETTRPSTIRIDADSRRTLVELAQIRSIVENKPVTIGTVVRELVAQASVRRDVRE